MQVFQGKFFMILIKSSPGNILVTNPHNRSFPPPVYENFSQYKNCVLRKERSPVIRITSIP